ncbi:proton-dependent oligopeptide transporter family [Artemisia annua]|uniref:Proton-dependent oligopeptide transporter family n=1 Tax=Artemisia annua TaxID=35608 RepID=A0A2U1LP50_ARTAN|nr:proton-dependent oligopeptide transporter family [Artemisia annua]
MMNSFRLSQLPVDSVALRDPTKNLDDYLVITLQVFPSGDDRFNRTGILGLGFSLSNQTFKPPADFGTYFFIGENYDFLTALIWADLLAAFAMYVMMTYLTNVWSLSTTHAAGIINIWNGITPALAIVFAFLVDSFIGDFYMLVFSSIAYSIGLGLLTMSTPPVFGPCSDYKKQCRQPMQRVTDTSVAYTCENTHPTVNDQCQLAQVNAELSMAQTPVTDLHDSSLGRKRSRIQTASPRLNKRQRTLGTTNDRPRARQPAPNGRPRARQGPPATYMHMGQCTQICRHCNALFWLYYKAKS